MEADSTTYENNSKDANDEPLLPFTPCTGNFSLYKEFSYNNGEKPLESQIVDKLQAFGLLQKIVRCPTNHPDCKVVCRAARVVDRVQWVCEGCGKRQPIRAGSFFFRLQCSILQALQMILAWCEDADCETTAQFFGVKSKVACTIYDRMDELAVKEQNAYMLGGKGSVVVAEMYPDCLTRLSPDTTDQPHVHRILMLADTNHIPTRYQLHIMKDDLKKNNSLDNQSLVAEVEEVIVRATSPGSILVTGSHVPQLDGAATLQQLSQHCDADMQHFLSTRIWRQALAICAASRDLCGGAGAAAVTVCAGAAQRYLSASMYRMRHADGFYSHMLTLLVERHTQSH